MRGRRRVVIDDGGRVVAVLRVVAGADGELRRPDASAEITDDACTENNRGEGDREREDRDERGRGNHPERRAFQRARADPPRRVQHDRDDGGLDPVENARHRRHAAVRHIEPCERDQDDKRGQHEQRARHDPAPRSMHEPSDVGRELLRFGTGKHHAVVQCMQESPLGDPPFPVDEVAMHDRDLPCRPAAADESELQPVTERFGARRRARRSVSLAHAVTRVAPVGLALTTASCVSRHHA